MIGEGFKATKVKLSDYEIKTTLGTGKKLNKLYSYKFFRFIWTSKISSQ